MMMHARTKKKKERVEKKGMSDRVCANVEFTKENWDKKKKYGSCPNLKNVYTNNTWNALVLSGLEKLHTMP